MAMLLGHPCFYSVVAEQDGRIVGSNFLDERSSVHDIGPITVDPAGQNRGVGARLMQDAIDRSARQGAGVRLLQAGFHNRSLCRQVHGFDRGGELGDAIARKSASVVEYRGRIAGYTTGIAFTSHTVAETNIGLMALIGAAPRFGGPGFLLPTRNHEVLAWCLKGGLKLVYQMTLMSIGLYNEPTGAYMPSVLY